MGYFERKKRITQGQTKHPAYTRWKNMVARCYYSGCQKFEHYGGRGISVCDEWRHTSTAFLRWADANGFSPELELGRENNDGDYTPENCRWSTKVVNVNNRRLNGNNLSGVRGVTPNPSGGWRARITVDKKCRQLGTADTVEQAAALITQWRLSHGR